MEYSSPLSGKDLSGKDFSAEAVPHSIENRYIRFLAVGDRSEDFNIYPELDSFAIFTQHSPI
ncbi:MAG: hypothetical protein NT070_23310 [Cyanobacteria bacterium]|nr:hypothetical protein [Cyanobacteriota bacterium]